MTRKHLKNSGASCDPPECHAGSVRQRSFGRRWSVGLGSGTRSVEGRRPVCPGSRPTGAADATARISGPENCGGIPRHAKPFRGDTGRAAGRRRREPPSESPTSSLAALPGASKVPTERPSLGLSDRKQVSGKVSQTLFFPWNSHSQKARRRTLRFNS